MMRVNGIIEGFERPESIDALLYRIRHDIVSKTANQTTDEVHGNNRFFTVAQLAGYGVRALNPNDVYTGNIPDEEIQQKLKAAFDRDYRLFNILSGLEEQIRSELLVLGYTGSHPNSDALGKSINFLTLLFKEAPAVIQQQEAEQRLTSLQQTYEQQVNDYMLERRQRVRELIPIEVQAQQDQFIDNIIRNKIQAPFQTKYMALLAKFDENSKNELAKIQQDAVQFFEGLNPLTTQMNKERARLVSPFLLAEEDEALIDWNQIKQSIWEECCNKQYFILTEQERAALDGLLDNNQPFKTEECESLNLSGSEVVFLLTRIIVEHEKKQRMLRWYISAANDTLAKKITTLVLMQNMSKDDSIIYCVLDELVALIQTGGDLADVLHPLSPEQCGIVFESMKEALPALIQTGRDFAYVLHFLSPERRGIVVESMKEALPALIQRSRDLGGVLNSLSPEQCGIVVESIKEALPSLIQTGRDLAFVLRFLSPEQCGIVFESIKKALPLPIKTGRDWVDVLQFLSPEQRGILFESMKEALPALIKNGQDLVDVLQFLSPEQCGIVVESIKEALPALIQTGLDLADVLQSLSPEQHEIVIGIKRLMDSLDKAILEQEITAFASALLSEDKERIKTQITHGIESSAQSIEWITALSNLDVPWVNKINAAFEFKLIDTQLTPEQNKAAIQQYFDSHSEADQRRITARFRSEMNQRGALPDDDGTDNQPGR